MDYLNPAALRIVSIESPGFLFIQSYRLISNSIDLSRIFSFETYILYFEPVYQHDKTSITF